MDQKFYRITSIIVILIACNLLVGFESGHSNSSDLRCDGDASRTPSPEPQDPMRIQLPSDLADIRTVRNFYRDQFYTQENELLGAMCGYLNDGFGELHQNSSQGGGVTTVDIEALRDEVQSRYGDRWLGGLQNISDIERFFYDNPTGFDNRIDYISVVCQSVEQHDFFAQYPDKLLIMYGSMVYVPLKFEKLDREVQLAELHQVAQHCASYDGRMVQQIDRLLQKIKGTQWHASASNVRTEYIKFCRRRAEILAILELWYMQSPECKSRESKKPYLLPWQEVYKIYSERYTIAPCQGQHLDDLCNLLVRWDEKILRDRASAWIDYNVAPGGPDRNLEQEFQELVSIGSDMQDVDAFRVSRSVPVSPVSLIPSEKRCRAEGN